MCNIIIDTFYMSDKIINQLNLYPEKNTISN